MDKQHEKKKLQGLEEGPLEKIHVYSLRVTLEIVRNWKMPGHDGILGYSFKKFTCIHDRLAVEMNRCYAETDIPE